jgi:hypothetical protein
MTPALRSAAALLLLAGGCAAVPEPRPAGELAAAEALIDAFYSFEPERLRSAMAGATESIPEILYYQGWAEGGNYRVLERKPCKIDKPGEVSCDIKVRDDLIAALGTGYDVTDTFHVTFEDGRMAKVRTSSNDPPEFAEALKWLNRERPDLMTGPCRDFFAGGPTPQACVREVVKGFAEFATLRRG